MQGLQAIVVGIAITVGLGVQRFETKFLDLKSDSIEMAMLSNPANFSFGEWALIASGIGENEFNVYLNKLRTLYDNVEKHIRNTKKENIPERIFSYLHQKVLKQYSEKSTSLKEIIDNGRFNCYSGTLLYLMLLDRHDIPYAAVILPDHIYALVRVNKKWISVETTENYGYDIKPEKQRKVGFRSRYGFVYPPDAEKNSTTNELHIIAYLYANKAYLYSKERNPYLAFQSALKAATLNPTGEFVQSNMIAAYNEYSKNLYLASNYLISLEVLKEGYRNYPNTLSIRKNLELVFNRYIQYLWVENNDLESAMSIMLEMSQFFPKDK